jgi:nucleoside triphosphate pyrophosphatase
VVVAPSDADETPLAAETGRELAQRLALAKATLAAPPAANEAVIGADSVVELAGCQLGKPADAEEARATLRALRGRQHQVITGLALIAVGSTVQALSSTDVIMRDYADEEIERSIASGEPFDKAGAYAIQDAAFRPVDRIAGCYLNVVGLPLCEVQRGLRALGWPLPDLPPDAAPCYLCHLGDRALGGSGLAAHYREELG